MAQRSRAGGSRRKAAAAAILAGLFAVSAPAAAQIEEPDAATLESAREIGRAGLALYDKGDCQGALKKFEEAYALYKAPTIGLMAARCEARLGRLAAAEARYRKLVDLDLGKDPPPAFAQAKQDAIREHQALLPRVPRLTIVIELPNTAAPLPQATLLLDGAPLAAEALGAPQIVEVGDHEVRAERGDAKVTERVTLREGENRRVVLRLDPAQPGQSGARDEPVEPAGGGGAQRAIGWAALGIGGAGIVAGAVLGGLAIGQKGDLDDAGCQDGLCPDALQGDVDSYNTMRVASGIGLIAGAALAAGGVVLLVTAPSPGPPDAGKTAAPRVSARVGLGAITVRGTF